MSASRTVRCAIYTRKSSEEGLEQNFNSLDAQHEACKAYITSQKQEGAQSQFFQFRVEKFNVPGFVNLHQVSEQRNVGDQEKKLKRR